jgi:hypothetical protein
MTWQDIGSTDTGQMPEDREWILFTLDLAIRYLTFVCGDPPPGHKLGVMWHEQESGASPSIGVHSESEPDADYIADCERALDDMNDAIDWAALLGEEPGQGEEEPDA